MKDILTRLNRVEDIQYKKLSMITPKMVKELHQVVGARSPYVANRLVEYLRLVELVGQQSKEFAISEYAENN